MAKNSDTNKDSLSEEDKNKISQLVIEEALRLIREDAIDKDYEKRLEDLLIKEFKKVSL